MVQIGNFHLGRAETAKKPKLDSGEAFLLWDMLLTRYDIIEQSQIWQNFAHDPEFKLLLKKGIEESLENQINLLETEMNTFELPLPSRPPKSVRVFAGTGVLEDRFLFRQIFIGIQHMLEYQMRAVQAMITNDNLRKMVGEFLKEEIDTYDNLVKYGKVKGWVVAPPMFQRMQ